MSTAFEISPADVFSVALSSDGVRLTQEQCEALFEGLDYIEIEDAALSVNTMDEQLEKAYDEIHKQLTENDELSEAYDEFKKIQKSLESKPKAPRMG